jgi:hypothetical protein
MQNPIGPSSKPFTSVILRPVGSACSGYVGFVPNETFGAEEMERQ